MEKIHITGNSKKPTVIFDHDNGLLEMSGKCILEDPNEFFEPLEAWIIQYNKNPAPITTINFKFEYFNTSASKWIIALTKQMKHLIENKHDVQLNWHYDDEDLLEYGTVIEELVDIKMNMIGSIS